MFHVSLFVYYRDSISGFRNILHIANQGKKVSFLNIHVKNVKDSPFHFYQIYDHQIWRTGAYGGVRVINQPLETSSC